MARKNRPRSPKAGQRADLKFLVSIAELRHCFCDRVTNTKILHKLDFNLNRKIILTYTQDKPLSQKKRPSLILQFTMLAKGRIDPARRRLGTPF